MAATTMAKPEAEKVQPTYVLISPYAFQTNKFIEFVAKIGPLFFAAFFLTCMILFHQKTNDAFWVLFLPQFVFFSLTFIIGCITNNKTFQLIQIVITYICFDYSYYLACFTGANFRPNKILGCLVLFLLAAIVLYAIALQIVHRKHYVKDLSTPESISSLNTIDFYHLFFFLAGICLALPLLQLLTIIFPARVYDFDYLGGVSDTPPTELSQFEVTTIILFYDFFGKFDLCYLVLLTCVFQYSRNNVNYLNSIKALSSSKKVMIDCDGRAWYCLFWSSRTVSKPKKLTGWNQSSVKPEDSQILPLKPLAELNV
uniref:Uncharacterized protein n=1 Tax=Panagrellus redivivus TaxID=6233 RepID=A0A7E4UPH2_PANRE